MTEQQARAAGPSASQTATFATPRASQYLQQLCKHFAHKVEARFDETFGEVEMPGGRIRLRAEADALHVAVEGETTTAFLQARHVFEEHLVRFAFRENAGPLDWRAASPAPGK